MQILVYTYMYLHIYINIHVYVGRSSCVPGNALYVVAGVWLTERKSPSRRAMSPQRADDSAAYSTGSR